MDRSKFVKSVVLPAPRKPDRSVTGSFLSSGKEDWIMEIAVCAADDDDVVAVGAMLAVVCCEC